MPQMRNTRRPQQCISSRTAAKMNKGSNQNEDLKDCESLAGTVDTSSTSTTSVFDDVDECINSSHCHEHLDNNNIHKGNATGAQHEALLCREIAERLQEFGVKDATTDAMGRCRFSSNQFVVTANVREGGRTFVVSTVVRPASTTQRSVPYSLMTKIMKLKATLQDGLQVSACYGGKVVLYNVGSTSLISRHERKEDFNQLIKQFLMAASFVRQELSQHGSSSTSSSSSSFGSSARSRRQFIR